jgi:hypothetical protein
VDVATGLASPWNPTAIGTGYGYDASVRALAVDKGSVYVGGWFTKLGGQNRLNLCAIDSASGLATSWSPNADDFVSALLVSDSLVYAGGSFLNIAGQARGHVAALKKNGGAATSWNPNANGPVYALAKSADVIYAGGLFSNIGGQARNHVAALELTAGAATSWDPHADRRVGALAVTGSTVYVGGLFTNIGASDRNGLALLDAGSGRAAPWNPRASPGVAVLLTDGRSVIAGGAFPSVEEKARPALARWIAPRSDPVIRVRPAPSPLAKHVSVTGCPGRGATTIRFRLPDAQELSLEAFDVAGRRTTTIFDWEMRPAGEQEIPIDTRGWAAGVYFLRLRAAEREDVVKVVVLR